MGRTVQISIRVPASVAERATRLASELAGRAEYRGVPLSRGTVLRMAVLRGLDELERPPLELGRAVSPPDR
jgi:hypothetical protein